METASDLVTVDSIIQDAAILIDDESFRKGLPRSYYVSLVQQASEQLALKTYFQTLTLDLPMPANLWDQLPKNFFNLQQLYAFSGSCCNVGASANIYYKRNFNNQPNGQGYTAMNKGNEQSFDPFFGNEFWGGGDIGFGNQNNKLFANIQNGKIMFSSPCKGYNMYRMIYSGMGGNIGDAPLIPRPLRRAVIDYVRWKVATALASKEPRFYNTIAAAAKDDLYNRATGSWWDALDFVKTSDLWVKESLSIYQDRNNW